MRGRAGGFGRVIGVDLGLVIPDARKTLKEGAIKTLQERPRGRRTRTTSCATAAKAGIRLAVPWSELTQRSATPGHRGSPDWTGKWGNQWYGVQRFFDYLESKAYKMHIRVLLSKYRELHDVSGVRRRAPEDRSAAVAPRHQGAGRRRADRRPLLHADAASNGRARSSKSLPGLTLHDLMLMPIERIRRFFDSLYAAERVPRRTRSSCCTPRVRTRLKYLCDVGLGYLTLDRQSRTLSGGEVQQHQPDDRARHLARRTRCSCPRRDRASACIRAT